MEKICHKLLIKDILWILMCQIKIIVYVIIVVLFGEIRIQGYVTSVNMNDINRCVNKRIVL
jgi:hypothetical protein